MKRFSLLLFLLLMAFVAMAQKAWTVQSVPNTRLENNAIHVSDPDDYLSDSAERVINTALGSVRDKADVFLVTLTSIGEAEPKHFATRLLNHWGIGDAETDNGVLLLFVEDQHALEFETGYGIEEVLTDARCERIFTKTIVPYFKAGDYEGGLCAGVADIVSTFGGEVPDALAAFALPNQEEWDGNGGESSSLFELSSHTVNIILIVLFALLVLFPLPIFIYARSTTLKRLKVIETPKMEEEDGVCYIKRDSEPTEKKGCMTGCWAFYFLFWLALFAFVLIVVLDVSILRSVEFMLVLMAARSLYVVPLNISVFRRADELAQTVSHPREIYHSLSKSSLSVITPLWAPWVGMFMPIKLVRQISKHKAYCPKCESELQLDETIRLSDVKEMERELKAVKYETYRCEHGHIIVVETKGDKHNDFEVCQHCGGRTMKRTGQRVTKHATTVSQGEREDTYVCQHCGETMVKLVVLAKLSSSSSSSGSSRSRSSSGGGSFGGGHSGGGGYSGRW